MANVKIFYWEREKIIEGFKNGIFPINIRDEEKERVKDEEEEEKSIRKENGFIGYEWLNRLIYLRKSNVNTELVKKHFQVHRLNDMMKNLKWSKTNPERNKIQVSMIKSGLRDLKEEADDMSEQDKEIERPDKIVNLVEMILEFNRQQQGQGLKILTPNQMLSRLPISLAQLKAGNNSEKLKNEIRQLLHSLYRSKKLTKQLYKSLIDII